MHTHPTPDWDPTAPAVTRDPRAAYDAMRRSCPVAYSEAWGWTLFRHADVLRVLHDPETFSNAVSRHLSVPNGMDGPEHTAYRRIIDIFFTPDRMAAFEPKCRRMATNLLKGLAAAGKVEVQGELARPFAVHAQCAFLNWPESWHDPLVRWTQENHDATRARDRQTMSQIAREFEGFIDNLLDAVQPADSADAPEILTTLTQEKVWGRHLSNEEIASILRNWTVGEVGTLAASVGILMEFLARHQDWQEAWRKDPSLLPPAIEEILRIHGPLVTNRRVTTRPVEIGGRKIAANERVTLNWVSANRDEDVFREPDTFRLDRNPADNLLWGAGIHVCPGAPLARMEMRVFLEHLLAASTRITLDPEDPHTLAIYPASGFATLPVQMTWS